MDNKKDTGIELGDEDDQNMENPEDNNEEE